ncbi:MAG: epoxyqueuosine reductase [Desulfosarcinaceae bacterium]|jgi:epoxyqueuosine reductase
MTTETDRDISHRIISKAKSLGACLAGVAGVAQLKQSPSHYLHPRMQPYSGVGSRDAADGALNDAVLWPVGAQSAVVIAVEHREEAPELDWWYGKKSPPGNRILMRINKQLAEWVEETFQITTHKLPYHIEMGGIFLKDAAVMAGLGCIGRNNIVISPEFGPRVRLRAMLLEKELPATGPLDFDPCERCGAYCRDACPQAAFDNQVFSADAMGIDQLPGRSGCFSRATCNIQMQADIDASEEDVDPESGRMEKIIKYCRACELACPVGQ